MGKAKGSKRDKKDKQSKSSRRSKRARHGGGASASDASSSGSDEAGTLQQQLRWERAAVATLRHILSTYAAVRTELRGLLWSLDQGKAVSITTIPDASLRASVQDLFNHLRLQYDASKGVHGKSSKSPAILSILGFVFEEPIRPAAAPQLSPAPVARPAPAQDQLLPEQSAVSEELALGDDSSHHKAEHDIREGAQPCDSLPSSSASQGASDKDRRSTSLPAHGPGRPSVDQAGGSNQQCGTPLAPVASTSPPRRVVGPAMPPPELLAAAAAAAAEQRLMDEEQATRDELGDSFLVGPPPPELLQETDAAPENERDAEVVRIIHVLEEAAIKDAAAAATAPAGHAAKKPGNGTDSYAVLGVEASAGLAEIKKRYMRLSLLIHPDKCKHPSAHEAFQALSVAAKLLQDSTQRAALNAHREDAELRKLAAAEAERLERERLWRVVRGEEPAGPAGGGPQQRESWMLDLPPERVAPTTMQQVNVTSFSRVGIRTRGDTSEWTATPASRAAQEAQDLLQGGPALHQLLMLTGAAASAAGISPGGHTVLVGANIMDAYNSQARPKTLLEQHQEGQAAAVKAARKQQRQGNATPVTAKAATAVRASGAGSSSSDGEDGIRDNSMGAKEHKKNKKKHKHRQGKERGSRKRSAAAVEEGLVGAEATPHASNGGKEDWVGKHPWRPFDRDKDLVVKPANKSAKQLMGQASGALSGMFSSGGTQRQFL